MYQNRFERVNRNDEEKHNQKVYKRRGLYDRGFLLIYSAEIDLNQPKVKYVMEPIGQSHYSGKDGNLYTELGTITTAQEITEEIVVILKW